jgi:hypothetical protein
MKASKYGLCMLAILLYKCPKVSLVKERCTTKGVKVRRLRFFDLIFSNSTITNALKQRGVYIISVSIKKPAAVRLGAL